MGWLTAAAAGSSSDPTVVLLQYGVLGIAALVLGSFAYSAYKRERDRSDKLEGLLQAANDRLVAANEKAADKFAEVLIQTRDALTAVNQYLRDSIERSRR